MAFGRTTYAAVALILPLIFFSRRYLRRTILLLLPLAQVVIYLATTAKSNAGYVAFGKARDDVREHGTAEVPRHLRNAPTKLMKELGYGTGYQYDHDAEGGIALDQTGFPDAMGERIYYEPVDRGLEIRLKEKLDRLRAARRKPS